MEERKQVVDYNSAIYFEGNTLSEIIDELQDLMKVHGNLTMRYGYADRYDETEHHFVSIMRPETDIEMEKRLIVEAKYRKEQEDREKQYLEVLKKKYEG